MNHKSDAINKANGLISQFTIGVSEDKAVKAVKSTLITILSERNDEIEKQIKTLLDGIKKSHSK